LKKCTAQGQDETRLSWRPVSLCCFQRDGIGSLVQWLTTVSLDFDKARDYACRLPLIQQLHSLRVEKSAPVNLNRVVSESSESVSIVRSSVDGHSSSTKAIAVMTFGPSRGRRVEHSHTSSGDTLPHLPLSLSVTHAAIVLEGAIRTNYDSIILLIRCHCRAVGHVLSPQPSLGRPMTSLGRPTASSSACRDTRTKSHAPQDSRVCEEVYQRYTVQENLVCWEFLLPCEGKRRGDCASEA
jgi:hypothetical protein